MFRNLGRNNYLLMLSLFIWALGEGLWVNLRQLYLVELGATPEQVGLALSLEALSRALLPIPAGMITDRIGPYKLMVASWIMGIAGVIMIALAPTWTLALPGLLVYAASVFAIPAFSVYILLALPQSSQSSIEQAMTTIYAAFPIGFAISPTIGGIIAQNMGIRANLWIATVIFSISTIVMLIAHDLKPTRSKEDVHFRELFRNRRFLILIVFYFFMIGTLWAAYALMPNYLQDTRGFTYDTIGYLFSGFALGQVTINLLAGRVDLKWGFPVALGIYGLAILGIWQLKSPLGVGFSFFLLGSLFTTRALITAGAAKVVERENRGVAFGMVEVMTAGAIAVAASMAGQMYDVRPSHDLALIVAIAAVPLWIVVWFFMQRWQEPVAANSTLLRRVQYPRPSPALRGSAMHEISKDREGNSDDGN